MIRARNAILFMLLLVMATAAQAQVVISQVYGGAGCGTVGCSTYKNDYIEVFNRGSTSASVNGWSVQYSSATGTTWQVTNLPNVSIPAGGYLLIAESSGANGVSSLPAPDATGTIAMSATAGKVALVNATTALSGACPAIAGIQDLIGYGATASCNEGGANAPAPSTTTADLRASSGCTDTNSNSLDFATAAPNPRNSASSAHSCFTTPTLTVTAPVTINEGDSGSSIATFTVNLDSAAPAGGVTFTINTADGTATGGSDYLAIVNGSGSIAAGATSTTIDVTVYGDTAIEGNENFSVNLSGITNATNTTASAMGTIIDDDFAIALSIDNVSHNEGNLGTTDYTFTVTLDHPAKAGGVTFDIGTADASATLADSDYAQNSVVGATIPAGSTSYQFTVQVNGDTNVESDETFAVNVSNIVGTNVSTASAQGTGTIVNDDAVPITLGIDNVGHAEGDSGTTSFVFTVSLSAPAPVGGVTFDIATADATATLADSDYVQNTIVGANIPAGSSTYQFTVLVNGDSNIEADETFLVNVSNIVGANVTTTSAQGTGTIQNDDNATTLSIDNVSHNEGNAGTTDFTFTVSLSSAAKPGGVTFDIATADGTATTANNDYQAQSLNAQTIAAGSTTYQFTVKVNGDNAFEPTETFAVNVSNISGTNVTTTSAQGTGTITNDDVQTYTIMQIQGNGLASPYNGQTLTTTSGNIVTAVGPKGFFMQDPVGDGDLNTSDGIFVFTSTAPTVLVGDAVQVTGKVQEFSGSTELTGALTISVGSSGNALPPAYVLDITPPSTDPLNGICQGTIGTNGGPQAHNFACLDGMLVQLNNGVVTGATFGSAASDGVHTGVASGFYATVSSAARPFREPGATYPGLGAGIAVFDGNPEAFEIFYKGLAFDPTNYIYNAGAHFSLSGVMQSFQASGAAYPIYEIYPFAMTTLAPGPAYPQAVADAPVGSLTIGSQNLLHFFNDTADGADTSGYNDTCAGTGASDTCPTHAQYLARRAKWTRQICDVLKAPVVLDIQEVENRSVAADLASDVLVACGVTYRPYVIPGNDVSGINIGILVRSDVTVNSVTQLYKGTQTSNCSSGSPLCLLNDRPPVLVDAVFNGYHFALLAIYDRSLSGLGDPTKPYIGPKRAEQAAQIASIVQAWQSGATLVGAGDARQDSSGTITPGPFDMVGSAGVPLIVAGDFNAYEFSDGYADVTGMIMGTAVQSQNLYWYNGDAANTDTPSYVVPNPTLVDSGIKSDPASHYSYSFSGFAQEIDHILLSRAAWKDFLQIGNAHGNADVSETTSVILDGSTAARSGDHDGQVICLAIDRIFADGYDPQP